MAQGILCDLDINNQSAGWIIKTATLTCFCRLERNGLYICMWTVRSATRSSRIRGGENTSVKTKKAEASDVSELVFKCSTNKPIGCQWLPAFCIAAAFQRSYDYRYWFYWCFLNFWSSLTCVTAVRCALHQPSLNGLKRVRLQQCCFVLSNDILIPRPPPSPIFFPPVLPVHSFSQNSQISHVDFVCEESGWQKCSVNTEIRPSQWSRK